MTDHRVYVNGPVILQSQPLTDSVFVAHSFFGDNDQKRTDYRLNYQDALRPANYRVIFADEEAIPGTLLSTICQHILNTEIGIYDITGYQADGSIEGYNENALIELGLALGLNRPALILANESAPPLPPFLEQLSPLRYSTYPKLERALKATVETRLHTATDGRVQTNFCDFCLKQCPLARKRRLEKRPEYVLVGVDADKDDELIHNFEKEIGKWDVTEVSKTSDPIHPHVVCGWITQFRQAKVSLFYLQKPYYNPDQAALYVQMGIAAGVGAPWAMILPAEQIPPTDMRGLLYVNYGEAKSLFRRNLGNNVRSLILNRHPDDALEIYTPLRPEDLVLEEEPDPEGALDELRSESAFIKSIYISVGSYPLDRSAAQQIAEHLQSTLLIKVDINYLNNANSTSQAIKIANYDCVIFISDGYGDAKNIQDKEFKEARQHNIPIFTGGSNVVWPGTENLGANIKIDDHGVHSANLDQLTITVANAIGLPLPTQPPPYPDQLIRSNFLKEETKGKPLASDVNLQQLITKTSQFAEIELRSLVQQVAFRAAWDERKAIPMEYFEQVITEMRAHMEKRYTPVEKKLLDVFMCYSRKDIDIMKLTRDYLSSSGLTVWTDENLTPGTPAWTRAIEQAIREAHSIVVIMSPDAKDSDWVEREIAVGQDSCRIPVFPILVRGDEHTAIPLRLAATQFADARRDVNKALERLTNSITTYLINIATDTQPVFLTSQFIVDEPSAVVAKTGKADFRTIGEAVEQVAENTIIIVREGLYQESLTLNKSVIIKGEGKRESIILEGNNSSCIKMATEYAEIQGITLRTRVNNSLTKHYTVDIPEGKLILTNCEITSNSLSCVAIHGKQANPILRKCIIHDSKQSGILVYEQGIGLIENCDIYSHTATGIEIREDANPTFRRCKIHHSKEGGVMVHDNGAGLFEDCDIFSNTTHGFIIRSGGNPTVRRCTISRNASYGIYVYDQGRGIVENCDLRGNKDKAWMINDWCVVRRRDNKE